MTYQNVSILNKNVIIYETKLILMNKTYDVLGNTPLNMSPSFFQKFKQELMKVFRTKFHLNVVLLKTNVLF